MTAPHSDANAGALLNRLLDAALAAADPVPALRAALPAPPRGRTAVVAIGKAAPRMAAAFAAAWPGPLEGVVTVPGDAADPDMLDALRASGLTPFAAGHPVPDAGSEAAAHAALALAGGLGADDLLLCLLSGGGSALFAAPLEGITLDDKQVLTRALLASGARIDEINLVRRQLSAVKGGGLARAAHPARVVTLAVSDVVGDTPAVIASGPTVATGDTPAEALDVLGRYGVTLPTRVRRLLESAPVPPTASDDAFARDAWHLLVRPMDALHAAAAEARRLGVTPLLLGDALEGDARATAVTLAGIVRAVARDGVPVEPPAVLLSGGELTVRLDGQVGTGGPNTAFVLALALALDGAPGIHALAVDTDGLDGSGPGAGGRCDPLTLVRLRKRGVDARAALAGHDAGGALAAIGDVIETGPTGTNVNDFRAILVNPRG